MNSAFRFFVKHLYVSNVFGLLRASRSHYCLPNDEQSSLCILLVIGIREERSCSKPPLLPTYANVNNQDQNGNDNKLFGDKTYKSFSGM